MMTRRQNLNSSLEAWNEAAKTNAYAGVGILREDMGGWLCFWGVERGMAGNRRRRWESPSWSPFSVRRSPSICHMAVVVC